MNKEKVRREIDVRKQHRMSLRETWTLCIRGVKHRLFRSALTLAVVVLAVAFFMFLLCESMFQRAVGHGVDAETEFENRSQTALVKFLEPATDLETVDRLAAARKAGDADALAEAAAVTGMPAAEVERLAADSLQEKIYSDWLEDEVPMGRRLILVGRATGRAAFARMKDPATGPEFHRALSTMYDLRVPGKAEGLDAFLAILDAHTNRTARFARAWNEKVAEARRATAAAVGPGGQAEERWIASAPEAETEAWRASLAALGFRFRPEDLALMRRQFAEADEYNAVADKLTDPKLRADWTSAFRENHPSTPEEKMAKLRDPKAVELLGKLGFGAETLARASDRHARRARLAELSRLLAVSLGGDSAFLGLSGRQLFLLAISFLVCMVGIANAMLMSITERYREIATMKCLGATDGYILSQFMMEASLQGFFGGLIGVVLGFLIALVRGALAFGGHLSTHFPAGDIALSALFSLAAGVLLAALASIQPSWSASRMAPMEAMRVE